MFSDERKKESTAEMSKSSERGKKHVLDTFITYLSTDPKSIVRKLEHNLGSSRNLKIYDSSMTDRG